jgi:hypothetical protein
LFVGSVKANQLNLHTHFSLEVGDDEEENKANTG